MTDQHTPPHLSSEVAVPLIFVHVFYPDVWEEMAQEIASSFDRPFAVVATCRDPDMPIIDVPSPYLVRQSRFLSENRGRDVLPFLRALRDAGTTFDIGLKLHTKRSKHRGDGEAWRRHLTGSLLRRQPGEREPDALRLMEREPKLGLVAPDNHFLPLASRQIFNKRAIRRVSDAIDLPVTPDELEREYFAAGSMFWFRRTALEAFAKPELDPLFEKEKGQLDGTSAHAAERLFAVVAERAGTLATATEALPALQVALRDRPQATLGELRAVARLALRPTENPFILPVPDIVRKYPYLMLLAHYVYNWLPRPVFRLGRWGFRRFVVRGR